LPCAKNCSHGCVRSSDCNLCLDPLCQDCSHWDNCNACLVNAEMDALGVCHCNDHMFFNKSSLKCEFCHEHCETCTGRGLYECVQCAGVLYKTEGTICVDECASGMKVSPDTESCTPKTRTSPSKVTFNRNDTALDMTEFLAVAHATPIYLRGLWFNGLNNYIELEEFVLNPTFSLNFWVRASGQGNLFSINLGLRKVIGEEDILNLKVLVSKVELRVIEKSDIKLSSETAANAIPTLSWHMVSLTAVWGAASSPTTKFTILIDEVSALSASLPLAIVDTNANIKMLGAEMNVMNGSAQ
jgi:hypothetical protein